MQQSPSDQPAVNPEPSPDSQAADAVVMPASFAQQRLWFLDRLEPDTSLYNIPLAFSLTGPLDVSALDRALDEIVARHEVLRTTFALFDSGLMQLISPARPRGLRVLSLEELPPEQGARRARELAAIEAARPFDLARGPLFRTQLIRVSPQEHVLTMVMHHIISDGWSTNVLLGELSRLYAAYTRGLESPLEELPIQYADYAVWQREELSGERLDELVAYWREQLKGGRLPALKLSIGKGAEAAGHAGGTERFEVGAELRERLARVCRSEGVTLFMLLLAAWDVLLWRYSGEREVSVGTPVANRTRSEVEGLIGFFVNTLVLRVKVDERESFRSLLRQVREVTLGAFAHQDIPFEKLVEELQPERSLGHSPLYQVMINLQTAGTGDGSLAGLRIGAVEFDNATAKADLSLSMFESAQLLGGAVDYRTDLFDEEDIRRMIGHYLRLLEAVADDPGRRVSELPLLTEAERHRLLVEWTDTRREYQGGVCIHELFEAQAGRTPEAAALDCGGRQLTYRELNDRATRLARRLRVLGVRPEVRVGVLMERSADMVVALLGVLKAGGAYVPLDPRYPQERLDFMMRDSQASVLLTEPHLAAKLPDTGARIVSEFPGPEAPAGPEGEELSVPGAAENLAYIIYTSGSTGRPKGVGIEHRSAVAFLQWAADAFADESLAGVVAATSVCFDLSIFEIFAPLSRGGKVILVQDALSIAELSEEAGATLVNTVPSVMTELLRLGRIPASVRTVNLAGEPLRNNLAQEVYRSEGVEKVFNLYGPSESTTYSTWASVEKGSDEPVTVGRAIANTEVYLLDGELRPVPVGVVGELYIGGCGLARGYFRRPGLTAERFVPHPFGRRPGERLYRTGDLARFRADGEIELLGRNDQQVKLRGYRIELGEIESAVRQYPGVREAAVVVREDGAGEKQLVAYLVADEAAPPPAGELRSYLRARLPEYMQPSALMRLEKFPLTPNGKIDRKALPAPEPSSPPRTDADDGARTALEEIIASTWEDVLRLGRVGIHDNFFELGGHSLLATQVISRLRRVLGRELALRDFFRLPTVESFARHAEQQLRGGQGAVSLPPIVPVARGGALPLSFAQEALTGFLRQWGFDKPYYHLFIALRISGALDVTALGQSLDEIVRRHESFRTTFTVGDGPPSQSVSPPSAVNLRLDDLSDLPAPGRDARALELEKEELRRPFDLEKDLLLRARLLRLGEGEHDLILTTHHIVADGWSTNILQRELWALYEAFAGERLAQAAPRGEAGEVGPAPSAAVLPAPPVQYADFAWWQRRCWPKEFVDSQLSYWRRRLEGYSLMPLAGRDASTVKPSLEGAQQPFFVGAKLRAGLTELSRREGATLFMTMLAGFKALLHFHTNREDVLIDTPIAYRNRAEVEGVVGFFSNSLFLRTDLSGNPTFRELLAAVRKGALDAYDHQDMHFSQVMEVAGIERFQVMFAVEAGAVSGGGTPGGLSLEALPLNAGETLRPGVTVRDLNVRLWEGADNLHGVAAYRTDLFDAETVGRMLRDFEGILEAAAREPNLRLEDLRPKPPHDTDGAAGG